jgi:hypothetical protein
MVSLWNETDQVFAAPEDFETEEQARAYAEAFRKRFVAQGYYLTADGDRISPDDVELVVVPVEE